MIVLVSDPRCQMSLVVTGETVPQRRFPDAPTAIILPVRVTIAAPMAGKLYWARIVSTMAFMLAGTTVRRVVPWTAPLVAVIVVVPSETAVTTPVPATTVATVWSDDCHETEGGRRDRTPELIGDRGRHRLGGAGDHRRCCRPHGHIGGNAHLLQHGIGTERRRLSAHGARGDVDRAAGEFHPHAAGQPIQAEPGRDHVARQGRRILDPDGHRLCERRAAGPEVEGGARDQIGIGGRICGGGHGDRRLSAQGLRRHHHVHVSRTGGDGPTGIADDCAIGHGRSAVPVFPSLLAVMVAVPGEAAVTTPVASTLAIAAAFEDQVMVRPVSVLPLASRVVAVSVVVCSGTMVAVFPDTLTVATGAGPGGGGGAG